MQRIQINIADFKGHSEFKTLKDYNTNIEMFLACYKSYFTDTEYTLFRRLTMIACNTKKEVYGVSFASINYIMKQVNELDFPFTGCSETTFHRMKRKCIKLGILEIKTRVRHNNSQTTNLWIIKKSWSTKIVEEKTTNVTPPVKEEEVKPAPAKEKEVKQMTPQNTVKNIYTNKHINKRIENESLDIIKHKSLDDTYIKKDIPKWFVELASNFFSAESIDELWKMATIAKNKAGYDIYEADFEQVTIDGFNESIKALKLRKIRKNICAFFYGVMERMLNALYKDFYKPEEPFFPLTNITSPKATMFMVPEVLGCIPNHSGDSI